MTYGPARPSWLISLGWFDGREKTRATQDKTEALKYYRDGYTVYPVPTA